MPPENVNERSVVSLTINKEPDIFDNIQKSWQKIGDFTQFIYGVFAGISPWIYQLLRKLWNKNSTNEFVSNSKEVFNQSLNLVFIYSNHSSFSAPKKFSIIKKIKFNNQ